VVVAGTLLVDGVREVLGLATVVTLPQALVNASRQRQMNEKKQWCILIKDIYFAP
jgi:hypothetical protein